MKKALISMSIAIVMIAAIMAPAYAAQGATKDRGNPHVSGAVTGETASTVPAYGTPSLEVRYALTESKVNLMIAVLDYIALNIENASGLSEYSDLLKTDLAELNQYVIANDSKGFNAYIKETLHPDMQNASKAIKAAEKQFKAWGVSKSTVKEIKNYIKGQKDNFNVGAAVSAVAKNDKSQGVDAYLKKAGVGNSGKDNGNGNK